tara:strand:+ start:246 stop:422 length:177 start_codon:yes stop_codon:yes gene_type:complete
MPPYLMVLDINLEIKEITLNTFPLDNFYPYPTDLFREINQTSPFYYLSIRAKNNFKQT